ncbi:hypothetical protein [Actinoplanes utahensis]|uniref:Uncharacterized protein n=1 Tax=Actinoplanes utahensis TaxID=1869 RepID=A0A0A6US99_ACTUT|nr:hypothetical protein [Actinoplanes utahensis]KHD79020.1 hypothetical protein MB27_02840 [Actinoplanes utahensis]GIF27979.1 hypothetical protein Aut01nite_09650 [Actinoplanes utahensis]
MIDNVWWERNRKWATFALIALLIGLFAAGKFTVAAYAGLARLVSGGHTGVMAVSGWLLFLAPFVLVWLIVLFTTQSSARKRTAVCIGMLFLLVPSILPVYPGDTNHWLADAVSGPGGSAVVTGMRNGFLAGLAPSLVAPFVLFNDALKESLGERVRLIALAVPVMAFVIATLIAAVVLSRP